MMQAQLLLLLAMFWLFVVWVGASFLMVRRIERTVDRMEAATYDADRDRKYTRRGIDAQTRRDAVVAEGRTLIANNLSDSVSRADATDGEPGEAADAALRTGDTAEAITRRQDGAR